MPKGPEIRITLDENGLHTNNNIKDPVYRVGLIATALFAEMSNILSPKEPSRIIPFKGPIPPPQIGGN